LSSRAANPLSKGNTLSFSAKLGLGEEACMWNSHFAAINADSRI
jgi:hypothetical protein